jgi:hypothetical protein
MKSYIDWVKEEAVKINSDGCSNVSEWHRECCLEHDLGYYYGRDPHHAYRVGWVDADRIDRGTVDQRFLNCMQAASPLHKLSPRSAVRWLGVRVGGWKAWHSHRKLRP